jgi:hypothetical protein
MRKMGEYGWILCSALFVLALASGCSRPASVQASDGASASADKEKKLPFHPDDPAASGTQPGFAAQEPRQNPGGTSDLPFRNTVSPSLPAGTLLMVKLGVPLSSAQVGTNQVFSGIIEESVLSDGDVLVPSGTSVQGRVEGARSSDGRPNTGYVRLTLDSITMGGKQIPLHTASLFARGAFERRPDLPATSDPGTNPVAREIHLEKGRRLIFRVTAPMGSSGAETTSENTLPN